MTSTEWAIPAPPAEDVHAVRVVETGQRWNRLPESSPLAGFWIVDNPVAVPPPQVLDWPNLLVHGKRLAPTAPLWVDEVTR